MRVIMPLVNAKCTNCGATLKVDNTKDVANCEHCGSSFIIEKAINNYYTINYGPNTHSSASSQISVKNPIDIVEEFLLYVSNSTDYGIKLIKLYSLMYSKEIVDSKAEKLYKHILSEVNTGIITVSQDDVNCVLADRYPYKNEFLKSLVNDGIKNAELIKNKLDRYNCFKFVDNQSTFNQEYGNLNFTKLSLDAYNIIKRIFNSSCIMEFKDCIVIYASKISYLNEYDFQKSIDSYLLIGDISKGTDLVEHRNVRVCDGDNTTALRIKTTSLNNFCEDIINQIVMNRHKRKVCSFCGEHFSDTIFKKCLNCGKPKDY